jgi:ubiquinone biosynthesis protein UbiJ
LRGSSNVSGQVFVADLERANLLELMLGSVLRRTLASESGRAHARALAGPVAIEAGGMQATLTFRAGDVSIARNGGGRAEARVRGSLAAVLDAALGRRRLAHVLNGDLRVTGSIRVLWHVLALFRAGCGR